MAVVSIVMAPIVGRYTDKVHPRILTGFGFAITALAVWWVSLEIRPDSALWQILAPMALLGFGMAGVWAPLAATATRNLPQQFAGAGSGVYNATRQVGAVLGAAGIAVLIDSRLAAEGLASGGGSPEAAGAGAAAPQVREPFSTAMSQSLLLPGGRAGARVPRVPGLRADAAHDAAGRSDPGGRRAGAATTT